MSLQLVSKLGTFRDAVSKETMTTGANTIRIATVKLFADGTTTTGATFRQDLPREISCPLDWKNSLYGAAHFHPVSRNGSSLVPRTLSGGYLRHLPIAHTC